MSKSLTVLGVLVAATLATTAPAPISAATFDQLTYLTFSGSVQVPGTTLKAGTYRFRLANPDTGRNVLQVLSHDGSAVHAMFQTTPDYRTKVTEEATVTFKETPAGVPPIIKSLFYGGEYRGYAFVYPSTGPVMTSMERPQPEITYMYTPAPVAPAVEPSVPSAEVIPVAPAEAVEYGATAPVEAVEPAQTELPRTATHLPWVTAGGLVSLVLGLGVGLLRRQVS